MSIVTTNLSKIKNFRDLLEFTGAEYENKIAYVSNDFTKTFKQLEKDVKTLAGYIIEQGIQNQEIALIGTPSYEYIVAYMAITISNNIVVIISESLELDITRSLIETSGFKYAYVDFHSIDYAKECLIKKHCESTCGKVEDLIEIVTNVKSTVDVESIEIDEKKECIKVFISETESIMLNQHIITVNTKHLDSKLEKQAKNDDYAYVLINNGHGIIFDLAMMLYGVPTFSRNSIKKISKKVILGKAMISSMTPLMIEKIKLRLKRE